MDGEAREDLTQTTQDIWNHNAMFWDSVIGDTGNRFHRTIVEPAVLQLLALKPNESVLEIACGNGAFARTMAPLGVHVVASDFSANLLQRAQIRTTEDQGRIEYRLIDATKTAELLALGEQRFEAAVCNMGLMDMPPSSRCFRRLAAFSSPADALSFPSSIRVSIQMELQSWRKWRTATAIW